MSSPDMQVDMFEVQLGAGLLLQFRTPDGETIRLLADAGVQASGYPSDHVQKKLPEAIGTFDQTTSRIDLIIGTHYDADHLDGLVPVIEDQAREIGEAWMPPVANDTEAHPADESPAEHRFLAFQFAQENGDERLRDYLAVKRDVCDTLKSLEDMAVRPDRTNGNTVYNLASPEYVNLTREAFSSGARKYFEAHIGDAARRFEETSDISHADIAVDPPSLERIAGTVRQLRGISFGFGRSSQLAELRSLYERRWRSGVADPPAEAHTISFIRRAAAKDAINATSLASVVQALKKRNIPIRCCRIPDGQPRRFSWQRKDGRFIPSAHLSGNGPELCLLGPSEGLIKKHWDRLPIGEYAAYAAFTPLPVKSITPSNQLSYVVRVGFAGQGILISGDAGCVDFKTGPRKAAYFPELLKRLLPLHIVQVAHHGGNNAHFYNALLAAHYPEQKDPSYLLLSHATDDRYRPSEEFGLFIEQSRKDGDDMQLLFTSRPDKDKVRDYLSIIHPTAGPQGEVGDVRLQFSGNAWKVCKHAVRVGD